MKIVDIYKNSKECVYSVEVLPPRNGNDETVLFDVIEELLPLNIKFASITMGSDMSLRGGSLALASGIKKKFNLEVLAHCTSVNRSREEIENLLTEYRYLGLDNILALRGDPPIGENKFVAHKFGHKYASDMISQIVKMNEGSYMSRKTDKATLNTFHSGMKTNFCIACAGHPDGHPDCKNFEDNFLHLKKKQDNGAEFIITQAFYDIDIYKRFIEKAEKTGITIPIIAGIMPVINPRNLNMVQKLFNVCVPKKLLNKFEDNISNPDEFKRIGIDHAIKTSRELKRLNVAGIQFFSLNRLGLIKEIISRIDV